MTEQTPSDPEITINTITHFNEVFNQHDVGAVMALMTDDVVFENTSPFPDGARYVGQAAGHQFWSDFFRGSPHAHFETEDIFAAGDRCTVRWVYHWVDESGKPGHIRGVDVFRVRAGKVAEKFSYVKG